MLKYQNILPYDYSRCINDECPLKTNCLRYTDRPKVILSYTLFKNEGNKCEYQIKNYDNKEIKRNN